MRRIPVTLLVIAVAGGLTVLGLNLRWPEATGLAAGLGVFVVSVHLLCGPPLRGELRLARSALRLQRSESATVALNVRLGSRRRRWVRLVEGAVTRPNQAYSIPRDKDSIVHVNVDTSERGRWVIGPYALVQGDPWGFVRRVIASADGGTVLVHPRIHRVTHHSLTATGLSDSERATRHRGEEHFHALRDYVLGDEPRTVHWRSSARAGRLVVRQQVAAASNGALLILDTDLAAYAHEDRFAKDARDDRFELAVEAIASLAAAYGSSEQVHLAWTTRESVMINASVGRVGPLLDALAVVEAVPPVDSAPLALLPLAKRTRCQRVVLVSGTPSSAALTLLQGVAQFAQGATLLRVDASGTAPQGPWRVLDVRAPEDLQ